MTAHDKRDKRGNAEGTYYTRPDGRIQYRVMVDGVRITGYGRTKAAAKAAVAEKLKTLGSRREPLNVAALVEAYRADGHEAHGIAPSTFDQRLSLLRTHVVPVIGSRRVDAVTKRHAADLVRDLAGSAATRNAAHKAAVALFDYAEGRGIVGANVFRQVRRPSQPRTPTREMSSDEARRLLAQAKGHRLEVVAWLMIGCGLRRGEALALRWEDVDLEAASLSITGNVTRTSAGLVRGEPKTQRGRRSVPMSREVVSAMKAHRKRQAREKLQAGSSWRPGGLVVCNEIGGMLEPRNLSRLWARWADDAGLSDTGTHLGRHHAATALLSSGQASVADVAAMLGHDPAVLLRTYASAAVAGQRAAADALGASLRKPPSKGQR